MSPADEAIPEILKTIRNHASCYTEENSKQYSLQNRWTEYVHKIRETIPDIQIEQAGESLYLGELSRGCQACKQGQWDCIFLTMRCNLECPFCWRPHEPMPHLIGSALAESREELSSRYECVQISGVSFSGGEPFLEYDKLREWVAWFASRYSDKYYWIYTNGLLATEKMLADLAELGVHEIRFNMAASGYTHPQAMQNLALAVKHLPYITVEIPSIPEDKFRVLDAVDQWCDIGVGYLNLHELVYEPHTNSAVMSGARERGSLQDGHRFDYNPESRSVTMAVMEKVHRQKIKINVNDCSLQSKVRQLRGRRRFMSTLFKKPYEEIVYDNMLECFCAYRDGEVFMFNRSDLKAIRSRHPHHRFVRLGRTVPLNWNDQGQWCLYEPLT